MNQVAHVTLTVGTKGLQKLKQILPDLVRYDLQVSAQPDGYLEVRFGLIPENLIWEVAEKCQAFAVELGPDSGGPGYAGGFVDSEWLTYEIRPFNLRPLSHAYIIWRDSDSPILDIQDAVKALKECIANLERQML